MVEFVRVGEFISKREVERDVFLCVSVCVSVSMCM